MVMVVYSVMVVMVCPVMVVMMCPVMVVMTCPVTTCPARHHDSAMCITAALGEEVYYL